MDRSPAARARDIHLRLQHPLLADIEHFRRGERDIPSRPEAVRRLLQRALARQDDGAGNGEVME